jgi:hypothetical protein
MHGAIPPIVQYVFMAWYFAKLLTKHHAMKTYGGVEV